MPETVTLQSSRGEADVSIELIKGGLLQFNVFLPPAGAGFFLVYPEDQRAQGLVAVQALLDGEPLPENAKLSERVPDAVVAGSVARPKLRAHFGTPKAAHLATFGA